MNRLMHTLRNQVLRKKRVRAVISGSAERPRLSIHISNRHITAQLIDDTEHRTLAYVATTSAKGASGTMVERAQWVGTEIAKKAKAAKIKHVVFDRGGHIYHGRVQALADAARKEGLEF